jgi:hypothetical protein
MLNPVINNHVGWWCNPDTSRGSLPGPMAAHIGVGVSETFTINKRMGFRFDATFFDLRNHPNFENPGRGGQNFGGSNFGAVN